jgi:uroporphyrin-III C-methyltransferase
MGLEQLGYIIRRLISSGMSNETKIAIIENATTTKQRVIIGNLDNIEKKVKQNKVHSPTIIIVGNVVGLRNKIEWIPTIESKW